MRTNRLPFLLIASALALGCEQESKKDGPAVAITVMVDGDSYNRFESTSSIMANVTGVGTGVTLAIPTLNGHFRRSFRVPNGYHVGDTMHIRVYQVFCATGCTLFSRDLPIVGTAHAYNRSEVSEAGTATIAVNIQPL